MKATTKKTVKEIAFVAVIVAVLVFCLVRGLGWWTVAVEAFAIASMLMVRVVFLGESKDVAFYFLEEFCCEMMSFSGFHYDSEGYIVPGAGRQHHGPRVQLDAKGKRVRDPVKQRVAWEGHTSRIPHWCIWRLFGLVIYLRPFVRPVGYGETNDQDGLGDGIYVNLNDVTFQVLLPMAETSEQGKGSGKKRRTPLNLAFTTTTRIINPFRWRFRSNRNVARQVVQALLPGFRELVVRGSADDAQQGRKVFNELVHDTASGAMIIRKIRGWGLEIGPDPSDILVESVSYTPEMQAALQAAEVAELNVDAETATIYGPIKSAVADGISMKDAVELRKARMAGSSYRKSDDKMDISSAGGPLPESITTLVTGGQGSANVLVGGQPRKSKAQREREDLGAFEESLR